MVSGRSTKKILQGGSLLAINGAMTPIGSHLVHPWSFPTAKGTYKSTSLKRQIIWTYPPFCELPGVNFPECKRLSVSGSFFGGDSLTISYYTNHHLLGFLSRPVGRFWPSGEPEPIRTTCPGAPILKANAEGQNAFFTTKSWSVLREPQQTPRKTYQLNPQTPKNERNPYGKLLVSGVWGFWFQGYVENFLDHPFGVLEAVDVGFLGRPPSREPSAILSYIC